MHETLQIPRLSERLETATKLALAVAPDKTVAELVIVSSSYMLSAEAVAILQAFLAGLGRIEKLVCSSGNEYDVLDNLQVIMGAFQGHATIKHVELSEITSIAWLRVIWLSMTAFYGGGNLYHALDDHDDLSQLTDATVEDANFPCRVLKMESIKLVRLADKASASEFPLFSGNRGQWPVAVFAFLRHDLSHSRQELLGEYPYAKWSRKRTH